MDPDRTKFDLGTPLPKHHLKVCSNFAGMVDFVRSLWISKMMGNVTHNGKRDKHLQTTGKVRARGNPLNNCYRTRHMQCDCCRTWQAQQCLGNVLIVHLFNVDPRVHSNDSMQ